MESTFIDPVSSDEERPLDSDDSGAEDNIDAKFLEKDMAAASKASRTLTFYATAENQAATLSAQGGASLGGPAGDGAGPSPGKKAGQNVLPGPSKKSSKKVAEEPEPTEEEKARCEEMIAKFMERTGSALQSPYVAINAYFQKKRMIDEAMAAATGVGRNPPQTPVEYMATTLQARKKDEDEAGASAHGNNIADKLDLSALAKMPEREKQDMFRDMLMNRVRAIHPALCEKIVSMILQVGDAEIVRLIRNTEYLRATAEKAIVDLQSSGYYDVAKDDDVFKPAGSGVGGGKYRRNKNK